MEYIWYYLRNKMIHQSYTLTAHTIINKLHLRIEEASSEEDSLAQIYIPHNAIVHHMVSDKKFG